MSLTQRELAENITTEQGKTLPDAEGDVLRGLREYTLIEIQYRRCITNICLSVCMYVPACRQ